MSCADSQPNKSWWEMTKSAAKIGFYFAQQFSTPIWSFDVKRKFSGNVYAVADRKIPVLFSESGIEWYKLLTWTNSNHTCRHTSEAYSSLLSQTWNTKSLFHLALSLPVHVWQTRLACIYYPWIWKSMNWLGTILNTEWAICCRSHAWVKPLTELKQMCATSAYPFFYITYTPNSGVATNEHSIYIISQISQAH